MSLQCAAMDIKETAAALNKTVRAVERYKAQGKLTARYIKQEGADGRTREVLDFDQEEVKALKAELEKPSRPLRPKIAGKESLQVVAPTRTEQTDISNVTLSELVQIMRVLPSKALSSTTLPPSELVHKVMLTMDEAEAYSGLTKHQLEKADGLKKHRLGRRGALLIKRADLDAYIKKI